MFVSLLCKWRQHRSKTNLFSSVMDTISFFSFPLFNWESDHAHLTVCSVHKKYSYSLANARQNDNNITGPAIKGKEGCRHCLLGTWRPPSEQESSMEKSSLLCHLGVQPTRLSHEERSTRIKQVGLFINEK